MIGPLMTLISTPRPTKADSTQTLLAHTFDIDLLWEDLRQVWRAGTAPAQSTD